MQIAFNDFVFEKSENIHLKGREFHMHGPCRTDDEIIAASEADVLCMCDQFGHWTDELLA